MSQRRIADHPVLGRMEERKPVSFTFDGKEYTGFEGDTIAGALLAEDVRTLRVHEQSGTPRGIYCNIGHCYECRVTVDHNPGVRACLTEIRPNMQIESGKIQPAPLKKQHPSDELPHTYAEFLAKNEWTKGGGSHD